MNEKPGDPARSPLASPEPWSLVADGYNQTTRQYLAEFSEAGLLRLNYGPGSHVVDIACGPGTTAIPLATQVERITCVDFSEMMLEELRQGAAQAGVTNIETHKADGQALPFDDASFDIGISMFGLMFFPDRKRGFAELFRVLRPGGQALVSSWAPVSQSPLTQIVMAALQQDESAPNPTPAPSGLEVPEIFDQEMRRAGFADVEVLAVTRAVNVLSPAEFWHGTVRGTAPIAMLKNSMSEVEWDKIEHRAIARIAARLGPKPTMLASTAWLATGRKR